MKIAFADIITGDYIIDTLCEKPLGGSQSALCYLAAELATQGHEVFLLNNTKNPGVYQCYGFRLSEYLWLFGTCYADREQKSRETFAETGLDPMLILDTSCG